MDADRQGAIRLPGHAQRVDLDRRLLHAARRPQERSTGRPATTPITPATTRCCRCTSCSARPASGSRTSTSWTSTRSPTASTSSACCSTATRRTPIGTARSSRSTRPATIAPYQNATGLQVTSAVLAGMVWALENPNAGIVEADEMDFRRCLEVQMPYLGPVIGAYTDWTPLTGRPGPVPGRHRQARSLAVQERAGALTPINNAGKATGGRRAARFIWCRSLAAISAAQAACRPASAAAWAAAPWAAAAAACARPVAAVCARRAAAADAAAVPSAARPDERPEAAAHHHPAAE